MPPEIELSIIIISYNTKTLLGECLETLFQPQKVNLEIIVVDNASSDGSVNLVEEKFKKVKIIKNKANLGFAKATNMGIKIAKGKYVLLLNSDTRTNSLALKMLVDFANKNPEIGIVGARLLNRDGSIQPSVFRLPTIKGAVKEFWLKKQGSFGKYFPEGDIPVEVEAVVGAAMLIPKKVIDKIGLLNERYFMYFEDLDYCRRVRRAGFKVYYLPKAEVIHYHGASGKELSHKTNQWLVTSSKIYHGTLKYWLLTFIIWMGQKW